VTNSAISVSVFGLGKLGSVIAALSAEAGHRTIGVDLDTRIVNAINTGLSPFEEPGLAAVIQAAKEHLSATTDGVSAVINTEVSVIIVPTPSRTDGSFSNEFVANAMRVIGTAAAKKSSRHTVIVSSTVRPGSLDGELKDVLEDASGLKVGEDIGLAYNPAFIALGSIISDMRNPDMLLIGESDPEAGDLVLDLAKGYLKVAPKVHRMSLIDAEITKIAVNTFVTTKISFANMLSELCDFIPNSDVHTITKALGDDTRIGSKYLRAATGYGGPCFPRDNRALREFGDSVGVKMSIAEATDEVNDRQSARLIRQIASSVTPPGKIAILGITYKPSTSVVDDSPGVQLANELKALEYEVVVSDPMGLELARPLLDPGILLQKDFRRAIKGAELVAILTPWSEYESLQLPESVKLVDPWFVLPD